MEEKTFYDVHLHAFNLSHPYLRAFIRRFNIQLILPLATVLGWFSFIPFIRNKLDGAMNLLAVMEDDIDSVFLLLENCLREDGMLDNNGLHIGGTTYKKVVLTPLMMDFGYKRMKKDPEIHYNFPCRKPIRRQVIDVFSAVAYYHRFVFRDRHVKGFPHLEKDKAGKQDKTERMFEIYPFLGINTLNYEYDEIKELLEKYFRDYKGNRSDLFANNPRFNGDIDGITSNYAAGIKLYPPLDFDPWPDDQKERAKVDLLYKYCADKGIPVTAHGSEGGFNVLSKRRVRKLASISKWKSVLTAYPNLKLNIAHFPVNEKRFKIFPKKDRLNEVLELLANKDFKNLYVDFSCRATGPSYYKALKKLIDLSPDNMKEILQKRILFGTDFSVHLMLVPSYNAYYELFGKDSSLSPEEKDLFCSGNPERFLFG
ncbi:amidohydrolase family protein [Chloroflexota bacterium]